MSYKYSCAFMYFFPKECDNTRGSYGNGKARCWYFSTLLGMTYSLTNKSLNHHHHRHQHRHHDHDHGLGLVDQHLMHGIVDQVPRLLRLTPKHLCSFRIHLQNISDEKGDIEPDYLRKEERALGMLFVLVALEQDGTILKQQGYSRNCASPASLNTMRLGSESSWCEWPNYQHDLRNHGRLQQTICSMYIIWHCMFLHMSGQY